MRRTLTFLFCIFLSCQLHSQTSSFRVMWYNVENLFDTLDNPQTDDNEFTPSGARRWTNKRYNHKLVQLSKAIMAAGEWQPLALIGLCEVENLTVLEQLLYRTPLREQGYVSLITGESDARGIHVAMLFQPRLFRLIDHVSIPVHFRKNSRKTTRDILHAWGEIHSGDTLDVLLVHFPSRYGGEKESETYREDAARLLRQVYDSLSTLRIDPHILIMGDFNDMQENKALKKILETHPIKAPFHLMARNDILYNILGEADHPYVKGTHKYQGEWSRLDHLMVNGSLLQKGSLRILPESVRIFSPDFLLTEDKTWRGVRPFRTYYGYKYEGGYSDHLPLIADFSLY